jgi:hypothetical protein
VIINRKTIIPAKLLKVDDNGDYHLLCYLGFDNVQEKIFNKKLIKEHSDYYYIYIDLENGEAEIDIHAAGEYEYLIKEKYE